MANWTLLFGPSCPVIRYSFLFLDLGPLFSGLYLTVEKMGTPVTKTLEDFSVYLEKEVDGFLMFQILCLSSLRYIQLLVKSQSHHCSNDFFSMHYSPKSNEFQRNTPEKSIG